ncbi:hypothetical protein ATCCBAA256_12090 [Mycobacterium montefiorense]|nr:hypothetical protein ATCCBAA256_12090 [Mycobacterium montefiorense]
MPLGVRYVKPSRAAMLTTNNNGAAEPIRLASRREAGAAGAAGLVSTRLTLAMRLVPWRSPSPPPSDLP